jgi:hypothetical protein
MSTESDRDNREIAPLSAGRAPPHARQGRALVQHLVDACAPGFGAAHLSVIFPLQRILEWQKQNDVRPAQLSRQRRDNWLVREGGRELHHATQAFLRTSVAVVPGELSSQGRHDLLTIPGTFARQDFHMDPSPDTPEKQGQLAVDFSSGVFRTGKASRRHLSRRGPPSV